MRKTWRLVVYDSISAGAATSRESMCAPLLGARDASGLLNEVDFLCCGRPLHSIPV